MPLLIQQVTKVEQKNLIRQNFVSGDIGKNKAQVMASRYGRSFKQPITFIDSYLTTPNQLSEIAQRVKEPYPDYSSLLVIIDATDNNKTRLLIHEGITKHISGEVISLSSGNEDTAGQIIFSWRNRGNNRFNFKETRGLKQLTSSLNTPDFYEVFPNSPVDKLPDELSCAENSVSAPQNIHTNMTAANILFGYVNKLLNHKPISELAVFFDIEGFGQKVYRHTESDLKSLLSLVPNNAAQYEYLLGQEKDEEAIKPPTWEEVEEKVRLEKQAEAEAVQAELDAIVASRA